MESKKEKEKKITGRERGKKGERRSEESRKRKRME